MSERAVRVRPGTEADADAIEVVRVTTWKSAYRGIVSDGYLDSLTPAGQEEFWRQQLSGAEQSGLLVFVAEVEEKGVIGFACGGRNRGSETNFQAEIYAIYVLPSHQGQGIGRQLIKSLVEAFLQAGYKSAIVWVLAANPWRSFYKSLRGRLISERTEKIDERNYQLVSYGWSDLACFFQGSSER